MKKVKTLLVAFCIAVLAPLVLLFIQTKAAFWNKEFLSLSFQTLSLAVTATLLSFVFALPSAYIFTCKGKKTLVATLFILFVIPPFLLFVLLSNLAFWLHISEGFFLLSFAHMVSIYPYTLVLMILGFSLTPLSAKKSATLYASNILKGFLMFYFPFMKTSIAAAFLLGLSISMSQYIINVMLKKPGFSTLIEQIIPFLKSSDIQSASSYGIVFLFNIFIALYFYQRVQNALSKT